MGVCTYGKCTVRNCTVACIFFLLKSTDVNFLFPRNSKDPATTVQNGVELNCAKWCKIDLRS